MGFGTVIAQVVLFVLIILFLTLMMDEFERSITGVNQALLGKQERSSTGLQTKVRFTGISYVNQSNNLNLTINVINEGDARIRVDCLDLYVGGRWVSINQSNVSLMNETIQPGVWNPFEVAQINASVSLDANRTHHEVRLVTCEGMQFTNMFTFNSST